jgi:hypothetical protein
MLMLKSFETVIAADGNIRIPKTIRWRRGSRAIVVLVEEDDVEPPRKSGTIEVHFVHPRNGLTLTADIDPEGLTGRLAMQELLEESFIDPVQWGEFYSFYIPRTGSEIIPNLTFAQAGVIDKDEVQISLGGQGGGPSSAEIVHLVFASAAVALTFLNALRPIILKLLETKFRIVVREGSIEIEGDGATSVNKAIEILKAVKEIDGLKRLDTKVRAANLSEAAKKSRVQPAGHKTDKAVSKRLRLSSKPLTSKTAKKGSDSKNKIAQRKRSEKKRQT